MDKDGHNSHTNYEIEHQILALDFNDYIFLDTFNNCDYFSYLFLINSPQTSGKPGSQK